MTPASAAQVFTLRIIGAAGALLFAFFFALTWHTPRWVEDFAASYIEDEVAERFDATIDSLGPPAGDGALSRYAAKLYRQNEAEIDAHKELLKLGVREQLARCIPLVRVMSDELRHELESWIEEGAVLGIGDLRLENARLVPLIQRGYLAVAADLTREVRIFTASNALAFLVLLLASFLKREAVRALFIPGLLLVFSTLLCAILYVFRQNWLLTIVHGDYLGLAYTAYLGLVFLFFCDVWFNQCRVSTRILRMLAGV